MICIGFSRGRSVRSKLIRWATGTEWSHVWIEYPSHVWGGRWVAHSAENGVVKVPAEPYLASCETVKRFEAQVDLTKGLRACREFVGRDYDYKVIWNALLLVVHRWTSWKWLLGLASRDISRMTCSEFVATILKKAGLPEARGMEPEFITPGDLFKLCETSDKFRVMQWRGSQ